MMMMGFCVISFFLPLSLSHHPSDPHKALFALLSPIHPSASESNSLSIFVAQHQVCRRHARRDANNLLMNLLADVSCWCDMYGRR